MALLSGYQVLRNRNYRLFWLGQWVSLIGTWMQGVTQAWLLTRLTESPMALGFLGAASSAPLLVLVLVGGLASDRFDRRRVILVTQTLSLIQAAVLAALTLGGHIQPWHIIALAAVLGAINAFDIPARQAFVVELVGADRLPNAIALNSTGFNVARVVGPAIGGLLVAAVGEGVCFLLNSLSYIAVLWGLLLIDTTALQRRVSLSREPGAISAGLRYALGHRDVARILGLVGVISAVGIAYRTFLPAVARTVLQVGAWRYGLLMAAAGAGAGCGGIMLAGLQLSQARYRQLLPLSLVGFSVSLGAFALSRNYMASLLFLTVVGSCGIVYFNASNTLVQLSVVDAFRGRVMSVYTLMHQGTATFGSLILGLIAGRAGTPTALLSGAFFCLCAVGVFVASGARGGVREPGVVLSGE